MRRFLAFVLALVMLAGILPLQVFAEDELIAEEAEETEVIAEEPAEEPEKPEEEPAEDLLMEAPAAEESTEETLEEGPMLTASGGENILTPDNFPDPNFLQCWKNIFPDGLTAAEAAAIYNHAYVFTDCGISDVTGIEFFTNLWGINLRDNDLTTLDLSGNPCLCFLDVEGNDLTTLDLSGNPMLDTVNCKYNRLTSLNVKNVSDLRELSCRGNALTTLDLSTNSKLAYLYCSDNPLKSLNVSNNPRLTELECDSDQLTSLDVSKNTALTVLHCEKNQLTSLDVSKNTALTELFCEENQLTKLDIRSNKKLNWISCMPQNIEEFRGWAKTTERANAGTVDYDGTESLSFMILYAVCSAPSEEPQGDIALIIYDPNGGIGGPDVGYKDLNTTYTIDTYHCPTRTGFDFQGWNSSESAAYKGTVQYAVGVNYTIPAEKNDDIWLYAVWKEKTYKVTYAADGGSGAPAAATKYYTKDLTLSSSAASPKKTGYTVCGWKDSEGTVYPLGGTYSKNKSTTMTPIWKTLEYTVRFDGNGADNTMADVKLKYGEKLVLKNTFIRDGCTFSGKWKCSNGKTYSDLAEVSNLASTEGAVVTMTAQWTGNKYTVKFLPGSTDKSTVTGTMKDQTCTYGTAVNLTKNAFKAKNYDFKQWARIEVNMSGTLLPDIVYETYSNGQSVSGIVKSGTVYLVAQWTPQPYKITYNLNGGTNNSANPATTNIEAAKIVLKDPTRKGYDFKGWYTDSKCSDSKKITEIPAGSTKTYTLYAKWAEVNYTISYNLNGGANNSKNPAGYKVTTADIKLADPTRSGYTFQGWYKESSFTTKVTKISKGSTGNLTLYAKWSRNSYSVVFNANGGTGTMSNESIYCGESKALTANAFTRTGYTFKNWNTKADGSGTAYTNKQAVKDLKTKAGDKITLYAQWKANTYTVVFNTNGGTGTMAEQKMTYDKSAALTANAFKRTDYAFAGWNTKADGTGKAYNNKASVKNLASGSDARVTLYAQWSNDSYAFYVNQLEAFHNKPGYSSLKRQGQFYVVRNYTSGESNKVKVKNRKWSNYGECVYRTSSGEIYTGTRKNNDRYAMYQIGWCSVASVVTLLNRSSLYYYDNSSNPFDLVSVLKSFDKNACKIYYVIKDDKSIKDSDSRNRNYIAGGSSVPLITFATTDASQKPKNAKTGYLCKSESGLLSKTYNGKGTSFKMNSAGSMKLEAIQALLRQHPEGVYIHYKIGDSEHAVVLTRYEKDAKGNVTYYCIDTVGDNKEINLQKANYLTEQDLKNILFTVGYITLVS